MGNQTLLPALDFVPVYEGFKCASCNYYCTTLKSVKAHSRKQHANYETALPCKVQTLSTTCFKKWFGVEIAEAPSSTSHDLDIGTVVRNTMSEVLNLKRQVPEPIKQRNVFYTVTGWYPEPEAIDKYHSIDKQHLLRTPQQDEEHHDKKAILLDIFSQSLKDLNEHDYLLRHVVNGSGSKKPLTRMQNDATIEENSALYVQLVFFAWNVGKEQSSIRLSENVQKCVHEVFREPNRRAVYRLILNFLMEKPLVNTNNDCEATVPLFIRFSCYKIGSLLRADEIMRICGKLSILEIAAESPPENRMEEIKSLMKWVAVDDSNIFSFVCRIQGLARKVAQSENRLPIIARLQNDSPFDVVIHGITLTADQLRKVYSQALARCQSLLGLLLLGLEWNGKERVHDNLGNLSVGYQIMADKNPCNDEAIRSSLLRHILSSEELRSRFVLKVCSGKVHYRSGEVIKYLNVYDEYVDNLLLVVHIGSGMPARATELETYRIRNGPSTSRNIFYLTPQVFFHCEYSKTRSMKQANKGVSRFMDDLLIVRPFICSIATFLELNINEIYSTEIFVRGGTNSFAMLFYKYCNSAISFGEYRHIAKYYARELNIASDDPNCSDDEESEDELNNSSKWEAVLSQQFGHSRQTANQWYGRFSGELSRMRDHILLEFRKLSSTWHQFLNGKSSKRRLTKGSCSKESDLSEPVAKALKESAASEDHASCSSGAMQRLHLPNLAQRVSCSEWKTFVTTNQSQDSLRCLKLLYNDKEAKFKSSEQRAAVENVLHTKSDVLAILPTGCGKSLLFLMYAFKHNSVTSIVVVPTLSLQQDLQRRAESHGISCSITPGIVTNERLVLVTPEVACGQETKELMIRLYSAHQLGRIFVDEAHLFSTDTDFRPTFRQLPSLTFLPVPFVLLTATAPTWIVSDMMQNFFGQVRQPLIIRQNTNRLNIRYECSDNGGRVDNLTNQCSLHLAANSCN